MEKLFLKTVSKEFTNYKKLAEATFAQLSDEQLFYIPQVDSNSIAAIVKHLSGNMQSRWTDFLQSDGEKDWRNRDLEFEIDFQTRAEMMHFWTIGWKSLFDALASIHPDQLMHIIYIRQEAHTVMEAILRQLAHYPSHIGQIVFQGKLLKGSQWKALSIPKGQSAAFNKGMLGKSKTTKAND